MYKVLLKSKAKVLQVLKNPKQSSFGVETGLAKPGNGSNQANLP
jgi:hypothetical protein